ncbi:MAG: ABC transporter permease subunit [Actinobacteria bacterium]|nr:ABC transporter permease subunit [Actinomycetota bacterium]
MSFLADVIRQAVEIIGRFGAELQAVVWLTLVVSGTATLLGVLAGVPLGAALGLGRFRGRRLLLAAVNTGMGMPPVLAGLLLLLLLWGEGPLGSWGLIFTPMAMVIAQTMLAIPIAAGVTSGAIRGLPGDAHEQLAALRLSKVSRARVALREAWPGVVAAVAAAFGRVVSEVGAVLIIGGNIRGETRVLTTAIVQEARQARFGEALALGIVLMAIALVVNLSLTWLQERGA